MPSPTGNRITDNALTADNGKALIERALREIQDEHGWKPIDENALFSGIYYDSAKVGSLITRVQNSKGEIAVLKLQLYPLPFDEGFIIRHVQSQLRTPRIRLPAILFDAAWNESRGYGYLIFEDLSHLPHLWPVRPDEDALSRHTEFLQEFMHNVLPITPFLDAPKIPPQEKYRDSLAHFSKIANASSHRHIDQVVIETMKTKYLAALDSMSFDAFHFTHGHLSGHEIIEDRKNDCFILFANLLWSFRPTYYEVIFPLWVDLMAIRDTHVSCEVLLERIHRWIQVWKDVTGEDIRDNEQFWFGILERSMMTVMLDLGASEWKASEAAEKQALLNAWKDLFGSVLSRFTK